MKTDIKMRSHFTLINNLIEIEYNGIKPDALLTIKLHAMQEELRLLFVGFKRRQKTNDFNSLQPFKITNN